MSEWLVLSIAMASACAVVLTIAVLNNRRSGTTTIRPRRLTSSST